MDIILDENGNPIDNRIDYVARRETGRHYIGFEIEPKWFKIAQDRLNCTTANGQMSLFLT